MKLKYTLNQLNECIAYDLVADDYEAGELETCVPMPNGLYEPVTFNQLNQTWSGVSYEEWLRNQQTSNRKLTQQDEINAHFIKGILDLQLQLKELKANG